MLLAAVLLGTLGVSGGQWWEWGNATATGEYPLQVPSDLASRAFPIWHAKAIHSKAAQFILARTQFTVDGANSKELLHAAAFVTAQQSPFCKPDQRLITNDYGSCIPKGGTSQAKLLGGYKLFINGNCVGAHLFDSCTCRDKGRGARALAAVFLYSLFFFFLYDIRALTHHPSTQRVGRHGSWA